METEFIASQALDADEARFCAVRRLPTLFRIVDLTPESVKAEEVDWQVWAREVGFLE